MMETPAAILNARDIASVAADADTRFSCLVLGTNDLLKESRARPLGDRFAIIPWLAHERARGPRIRPRCDRRRL